MVQIVKLGRIRWRWEGNSDKDFWKLVRLEGWTCSKLKSVLQNANLPVTANASKEKLLQQHVRLQRGQLNYEACRVAELRIFCLQRGIVSSREVKKLRHKELARALDDADDGETFNRFLDLPAELRLRVYEFYLRSFDTYRMPLAAPFPIPLAEASSFVRQEVLPAYYDTCHFKYDGFKIAYHPPWFRFCTYRVPPMLKFANHDLTGHIPMLRKLSFDIEVEGNWNRIFDDRSNSRLCFRIDFGTEHKAGEMRIYYKRSYEEKKGELDIVEAMIRSIMMVIDKRAGGKKLFKSDIQAIINIFRSPPEDLRNPDPYLDEWF